MRQYPIEQYEQQVPRLQRRATAARNLAVWWALLAGFNLVVGILSGGLMNLIIGGVLMVGGFAAAVTRKSYLDQVEMIGRGQRPYGVRKRLDFLDRTDQLVEIAPKDFAGEIEEARSEGERAALRERDQWWRSPGSLWHQTQEFIDATQSLIDTHEQAEKQAEWDRMKAEQEAARVALRDAEQKAETERRVAATKRWLEEQREWDAFVKDAQVDARERKERGDWHEPPMGVLGTIQEENAEQIRVKRELEARIKEISDRIDRNIMASYSPEVEELCVWDKAEPVRQICSASHRKVYTGPQAYAAYANLSAQGFAKHYRIDPCGDHYHVLRFVR